MDGLAGYGIDLTIIDGALSRKSSASPAVSDAVILATGAALSSSLPTLVDMTAFCVEMIRLPLCKEDEGAYDETVTISSMDSEIDIGQNVRRVDVSGALTDRLLGRLTAESCIGNLEVTVQDFTRIFASPLSYRKFTRAGGRLAVRQRTRLLALCVNPLAPNGYVMDSDLLCAELEKRTGMPVYDIKRQEK